MTVNGETNHGRCKQCKVMQPERRNLPHAATWTELEDIHHITSGALHYQLRIKKPEGGEGRDGSLSEVPVLQV